MPKAKAHSLSYRGIGVEKDSFWTRLWRKRGLSNENSIWMGSSKKQTSNPHWPKEMQSCKSLQNPDAVEMWTTRRRCLTSISSLCNIKLYAAVFGKWLFLLQARYSNQEIFRNQKLIPFKSKFLMFIWAIHPLCVFWNLWTTRNFSIFQIEILIPPQIWKKAEKSHRRQNWNGAIISRQWANSPVGKFDYKVMAQDPTAAYQ